MDNEERRVSRAAVAVALNALLSAGDQMLPKSVRVVDVSGWTYIAATDINSTQLWVSAYPPGDAPETVRPMSEGHGTTLEAALAQMWGA